MVSATDTCISANNLAVFHASSFLFLILSLTKRFRKKEDLVSVQNLAALSSSSVRVPPTRAPFDFTSLKSLAYSMELTENGPWGLNWELLSSTYCFTTVPQL